MHSELATGMRRGVQVTPVVDENFTPYDECQRALVQEGFNEKHGKIVKEVNKGCSTNITLFTDQFEYQSRRFLSSILTNHRS